MNTHPARPFHWEAYEPEAAAEPFTTTRAAVGFVLRPVRSWEHRTAQSLEYADPFMWKEFSTRVGDLTTQLSYAVVFAPNAHVAPHDRNVSGITVDEFGGWLWIHGVGECDRVLDWLWQFFRARLDNRLRAALDTGNHTAAVDVCDALAEWFHLRTTEKDEPPTVYDLPLPSSIQGPNFEQAVNEVNAMMARTPEPDGFVIQDDLIRAGMAFRSLSEAYRQNRERKGLNGYREEAWGRFVSAIDDAKAAVYASTHEERPMLALEDKAGNAHEGVPQLGGYFAPEYAASLAKAYEEDPASFRGRGRGGFGALRKEAGLEKAEEETVKRQIGYKALPRTEKGFARFISLLFASLGREVPE